jgi:hypothetical protein
VGGERQTEFPVKTVCIDRSMHRLPWRATTASPQTRNPWHHPR